MARRLSKENAVDVTDIVAIVAEVAVVATLLFILFAGIWSFITQIASQLTTKGLGVEEMKSLIDKALVLFLIVELYRLGVAYIRSLPIVKEVFIAAFVAVGRKILIYDYSRWGLDGAISLSILMLAISIGYYLYSIRKTGGRT